jgi:hypothetical protein
MPRAENSYTSQGTGAGSRDASGKLFKARYKRPTGGFWNNAVTYTASCPVGQYGNTVTRTIEAGNVFSHIDQRDADEQAWELAKNAAESALVCYLNVPIRYVHGGVIGLVSSGRPLCFVKTKVFHGRQS